MFAASSGAVVLAARRVMPSLGLAVTLLVSTLGTVVPVRASDHLRDAIRGPAQVQSGDPAARLQVVIKQVKVNDDHDWLGEGDMTLSVDVLRCPLPLPGCAPADQELLARSITKFGAGSGETVPLNQVFPRDDELIPDDSSYAVYAGERYVLKLSILDRDGTGGGDDDQLGRIVMQIGEGHGLGIGAHKERSLAPMGGYDGDFEVEYKIRRAPLPDLRPSNITVHDLPGSPKKLVCMGVQNIDVVDAGPFEVALRVNGQTPPGGRATAGRLASGDGGDLCVEATLPASGGHTLAAVVDEPRAVAESNETNNVYEQPYQATGLAVAPTPTPVSARPDLTVDAIKVNGRVPDGKDDCADGKNEVTVVVKNQGASKAGDFVVRLVVDGDDGDASEKEVADGLDAGEEVQLKFGDVRLKEGRRVLAATADPTTGIAESDEANNTLKVTARCQGDT